MGLFIVLFPLFGYAVYLIRKR
ncbi:MAG: sortase B protein-sorting domain-containing protein [Proteobacteria bacterium]|nr:sortase B protein-sorting domain-containing protein [Pseudomonadota bacterium]